MSGADWLRPLTTALDAARKPVTFFFRDDDVGRADEQLFRLLDVFGACAVPVDLAVIPAAVTPDLARRLVARQESSGAPAVHQHGRAHINHEPSGRKCEFGPSRTRDQQRSDIEAGQRRLAALFGPLSTPIFSPPWNRCTSDTVDCLVELGFRGLSRDTTAEAVPSRGLVELDVTVDWLKARAGAALERARLAELLATSTTRDCAVGVMLHHERMGADDHLALEELLRLLVRHPQVRWRPMAAQLDDDGPSGRHAGTSPSMPGRQAAPTRP